MTKYDEADWLEDGEEVLIGESSRGKYKFADGDAVYMLYGDFVLTNKRLAILSGIFSRTLSTELRPQHLLSTSVAKKFKVPGALWKPAGRRVLLLEVDKDGKKALLGLALKDAASWLEHISAWKR
jgi:hypothetical protein